MTRWHSYAKSVNFSQEAKIKYSIMCRNPRQTLETISLNRGVLNCLLEELDLISVMARTKMGSHYSFSYFLIFFTCHSDLQYCLPLLNLFS